MAMSCDPWEDSDVDAVQANQELKFLGGRWYEAAEGSVLLHRFEGHVGFTWSRFGACCKMLVKLGQFNDKLESLLFVGDDRG